VYQTKLSIEQIENLEKFIEIEISLEQFFDIADVLKVNIKELLEEK